jgi:hypothetical protein
MAKKLRFLISSTIIGLAFSIPQLIQAMDSISKPEEQSKPSGIQLSKGADYTLEAVLGTGNNVLLKLSMDLRALKRPIEKSQLEKGKLEVPFRLFLTDFTSTPTAHPTVNLKAEVDCESTSPTYTLIDKPAPFDSYGQFVGWLKKGYFSNWINLTYDFQVDVQKSAPSLAQYIFAVMPSYRFLGTHVVENSTIQPDRCTPKITYVSERGNINKTTITLSGTLYLNEKSYPIEDHQQIFLHPIIDQVVFKSDETKRFYSHQWIAKSEATTKVTYEEFPSQLIQSWPNAPVGSYSILMKKPDDLEGIRHLACWDGVTGKEVDISDGRMFLMDCEAINKAKLVEGAKFIETIVKDEAEQLYTVRYEYPKEVEQRKIRALQQEFLLEKQELSKREPLIGECIDMYKGLWAQNDVNQTTRDLIRRLSEFYQRRNGHIQNQTQAGFADLIYDEDGGSYYSSQDMYGRRVSGMSMKHIENLAPKLAAFLNQEAGNVSIIQQTLQKATQDINRLLPGQSFANASFGAAFGANPNVAGFGGNRRAGKKKSPQQEQQEMVGIPQSLDLSLLLIESDIKSILKFYQYVYGTPHPRNIDILKMG